VKPGGRLAYVTCSLLREENEAQAERFLAETADFTLVPIARAWAEAIGAPCPVGGDFLRLTPARHGTDGFFAAMFEREKLQSLPASFEAPDGAPQDEEGC
jgi:16S rRNA (cytosine967-C5)-methyltransferase